MKDFIVPIALTAAIISMCVGRWDMAAANLALAVYGRLNEAVDLLMGDDET